MNYSKKLYVIAGYNVIQKFLNTLLNYNDIQNNLNVILKRCETQSKNLIHYKKSAVLQKRNTADFIIS